MRGILWVSLVAAMPLFMPRDAAADECSPVIVNKACTITVDREALVTPLPMRVWSDTKVTINVPRRPLEEIQFDVTFVDTLPPDVLGAVFGQLITPIKSFVREQRLTPTPPPGVAPSELRKIEDELLKINTARRTWRRCSKLSMTISSLWQRA